MDITPVPRGVADDQLCQLLHPETMKAVLGELKKCGYFTEATIHLSRHATSGSLSASS
jgi:hypothetical protein